MDSITVMPPMSSTVRGEGQPILGLGSMAPAEELPRMGRTAYPRPQRVTAVAGRCAHTRGASMRWLVLVVMVTGCAEGVLPGPEMGVGEGGLPLPPVDGSAPISFDAGPQQDRGAPPPVQDMFVPPRPDMNPAPMLDQGVGVPGNCQNSDWTLNINGQDRAVRFEVPANPQENAPRVLLFHGNGDNPGNFCATTNLCRFLRDRGALVAVPAGRMRMIQVGDQQAELAWDAYNTEPANEDVSFVSAIINEANQRCGAGPLYVWGHSQGGYFAFLTAMINDVQGAVVASAADPMTGFPWEPVRPFAMALLIGTLDFNIEGARSTAQRLRDGGHPVELREIEGAMHGAYLTGHDAELADFIGLR